MSNDRSVGWQDREALHRFQMIAPLLSEELDPEKRRKIREDIAEQNSLSVRTIRRYEDSYRKSEFNGLRPKDRTKQLSSRLCSNFQTVLEQSIELRKEVPERSVHTLIRILEMEELIKPGDVKRSTLQRHLSKAGFGKKQLQTVSDARNSSSKRFCKPNRMMLVEADIKDGLYLPAGANGKKVKTYLSTVIDDHSRFVLHSEFYNNEGECIVADTYRKAILKYGVFDVCYHDLGSQYRATQLNISLAKLGIKVRFCPVKSGKSKGVVEKFHQVVDKFLAEVKLKKVKTLEELNHYWNVYLEEYYQKEPHAGIAEYYSSLNVAIPEEGISPLQEFNRDTRPLKFLDVSTVGEAFRHHDHRKVDKGACISFNGKKYETKPSLIGFTVDISYDPYNQDVITVSYPGIESFESRPVKIGPYCDKNPTLPVSMQPTTPETSRLLDCLEKKHAESQEIVKNVISYSSLMEATKDV